MLIGFVCPDGITTTVCVAAFSGNQQPILEKCRLGRRCLPLPVLRRCAEERNDISVTRLLNGTMMEFLRETVDYSIRPETRAFALLGNAHHDLLEKLGTFSELSISGGDINAHPDLVDIDHRAERDVVTLWDYKTWGSYRVSRFLGLTAELIDDPSGAVYEKSGSWGSRGAPKQVKVWHPNPLVADTAEPTLQLNAYRIMLERLIHIDEMRLCVTVRDGGLQVAKQRGVDRVLYTFTVERVPDEEVQLYFQRKFFDLTHALSDGKWTIPCSTAERWDDERCRGYCEVAFACKHGREMLSGKET